MNPCGAAVMPVDCCSPPAQPRRAFGMTLELQTWKASFPSALLRDARWVEPAAVAEVYYRGVGNHQLLRQSSLKTMRIDKKAADLVDSDRAKGKPAGTPRKRQVADAHPADIRITHPERVVFPDDGITKQQVADYYAAVMKWFLPGVVNRPTSVIRCPEGTAKACFFQKHIIPA